MHEATEIDQRYGRIMNPNLQHYHVPANADVHEIETLFVEEDDKVVNPLRQRHGRVGGGVKEIRDIIRFWEAHLGERLALATLVSAQGSSYRRPDARMLISAVGESSAGLKRGLY